MDPEPETGFIPPARQTLFLQTLRQFFLQTSDTLEQGHDDQRLEISHFPLQASLSLAEGDQLGLMIRGGAEFGLGIFVTGVLINSAAWKLGLQVFFMFSQAIIFTSLLLFNLISCNL